MEFTFFQLASPPIASTCLDRISSAVCAKDMADAHTAIRANVKNLNVFICFDLYMQDIDHKACLKGNPVKMTSNSMSG
jgi:hypothetical protein